VTPVVPAGLIWPATVLVVASFSILLSAITVPRFVLLPAVVLPPYSSARLSRVQPPTPAESGSTVFALREDGSLAKTEFAIVVAPHQVPSQASPIVVAYLPDAAALLVRRGDPVVLTTASSASPTMLGHGAVTAIRQSGQATAVGSALQTAIIQIDRGSEATVVSDIGTRAPAIISARVIVGQQRLFSALVTAPGASAEQ
jgi:hypothetical protein